MRWKTLWIVLGWLAGVSLLAGGCRRSQPLDGTPLYASFNRHRPIAVVVSNVGDGHYSVAVRSLMAGRLAVRISNVRIVDRSAASRVGATAEPVAVPSGPVECVLGGDERAQLLNGTATGLVPGAAYEVVADGEVTPLDQPGRSMYREWAWLRRPTEIEMIDSELAVMEALPRCGPATGSSAAGTDESPVAIDHRDGH